MWATRSSQIFHRCQEPERPIERDLTCGISPIGLAVLDNEVEIEYGNTQTENRTVHYHVKGVKCVRASRNGVHYVIYL